MPITITSGIYTLYLDDSALLQCRKGLISEVIVIGIVNPIPLFLSLSSAILSSHFFPKGFCTKFIIFYLLHHTYLLESGR